MGTCAAGDFERRLKIISFYVKLLLRFLSDYNDTLWDQKNVFDALIGLTRCFYILEDKMSKNTHILLTNDIQNLLFAFNNGNQVLKVHFFHSIKHNVLFNTFNISVLVRGFHRKHCTTTFNHMHSFD